MNKQREERQIPELGWWMQDVGRSHIWGQLCLFSDSCHTAPLTHQGRVPFRETEKEGSTKEMASQKLRVGEFQRGRNGHTIMCSREVQLVLVGTGPRALAWQFPGGQAPEASGLRNGWGEGRGAHEGRHSFRTWAMRRREGGGSLRGRQDPREAVVFFFFFF